ncbi:hypothetical protein INR49_006499 [Caranx melampygus]|nr:hypothetical protein INR49_006499 [Caranx melampygus]
MRNALDDGPRMSPKQDLSKSLGRQMAKSKSPVESWPTVPRREAVSEGLCHFLQPRKTTRKLEWAFSLFDVDKNGYITKSEVTEICTAIFNLIPKDELAGLSEDENTADKRADKLWNFFEKGENDRIAEGEFIQGVLDNEEALRLIQYQPLNVQFLHVMHSYVFDVLSVIYLVHFPFTVFTSFSSTSLHHHHTMRVHQSAHTHSDSSLCSNCSHTHSSNSSHGSHTHSSHCPHAHPGNSTYCPHAHSNPISSNSPHGCHSSHSNPSHPHPSDPKSSSANEKRSPSSTCQRSNSWSHSSGPQWVHERPLLAKLNQLADGVNPSTTGSNHLFIRGGTGGGSGLLQPHPRPEFRVATAAAMQQLNESHAILVGGWREERV